MTQPQRPLSTWEQAEVKDLYLKEASRLFGRAIVQTQGKRTEAEDAVQEVFVRVAMNWDTVRDLSDGQRRAYLSRALDNKVIDQWRRTKCRREVSEGLAESNYNADCQHTEDAYDVRLDALTRDRLWEQLKSLPSQEYRVVYLSWELGWSTAMIAEHLDIQESTVRALRSFAVAKIRHGGVDLRLLGATDDSEEV